MHGRDHQRLSTLRSIRGSGRRRGGRPDDAAEAEVRRGGVDRLRKARRGPVSAAVVWRAEVRAALDHPAGDENLGLARIVALGLARSAGIARRATGLDHLAGMTRHVPVGGPLPDVADHVQQAVAVRRERVDRRGARVAVALQVLPRELALPGVGHVLVARQELVSPRVGFFLEPAAGGKLPFGLARQRLALPRREGLGIRERDVHDRMPRRALERAGRTLRMPPVGAALERPPVADIRAIDGTLGLDEEQRSRVDHVRQGARILRRIGHDLRERDVARLGDEPGEALVGHRLPIHPESVDRDAVRWTFLGIVVIGSHQVGRSGHPHHVREGRLRIDGWRCQQPRASFKAHENPPWSRSGRTTSGTAA